MPTIDDPTLIRCADRDRLSAALVESRAHTLGTFSAFEGALRATALQVPYSAQVNPPLWELGHVGWFQEYWIGRNPQRSRGVAADPQAPRAASRRPDADSLYDSGRVEHATRWQLALPDAAATRDDLARTLEHTLNIIARADDTAAGLYFAWLVLMHEDMHHEAALYTANALGIRIDPGRPRASVTTDPRDSRELAFDATRFCIGSADGDFAFDNELMPHWVDVGRFRIDRAPVDNGAYAAFLADGGYDEARHWTAAGWAWRQRDGARWPRYWRPVGSGWQQRWFGDWTALDETAPVCNLSLHEAQAWCRWAGRRLPTEVEWELAAAAQASAGGGAGPMRLGQVWEWTASEFQPYPGFAPHPYRDYSVPWFGTRQVLRGASFATHPRMRHPRYRNFFTSDRNDIFAGFRSCALVA
jgi:gamma-glutamyl hercynylcysteine S-oxide synthase